MTDVNNEEVTNQETEAGTVEDKNYQTQLNAMKAKMETLLAETKLAKEERMKAQEAASAAEQARLKKAKENGDFEQLLKSSEEQRKHLENELTEWKTKMSAEKVAAESMRLATDLADGANAELLSEFISRRLKYTDEGVKVLDASGNLTVSSYDDLKAEFSNDAKFKALLRGNQSSGGGAVGSGSSASGTKEMTRSAFEKLDAGKRMEFFKNGGKLTDE